MAFWQIFVIFSILSSLCVLWPFFRRWQSQKKALRQDIRQDIDEATLADREKELESLHLLGDITELELASLKKDLGKTKLQQQDLSETLSTSAIGLGSKSKIALLAAAVLVPSIALWGYLDRGAKPDLEIRNRLIELKAAGKQASDKEINDLILTMRERLEQRPEKDSLWMVLAIEASEAGMYEESVRALRVLTEKHPTEAKLLTRLAEALFLRAGQTITPEARDLLKKALLLDPQQAQALHLSGVDQFFAGNFEGAIAYWTRAMQTLDPSSADARILNGVIARARIAAKRQSEAQGKSQAVSKTDDKQNEAGKGALKVNVTLGDNVKGLQGDEVLFIYARAWQGPKMPLAIQRLSVSDLPANISLDSSMAMAQGMDINSVSQLEVVARISASGSASPQSGDWNASYGPIVLAVSEQPIKLQISEKIP